MNERLLASSLDLAKLATRHHSTYCVEREADIVQVFCVGDVKWIIARTRTGTMDTHPLALAATFQSGLQVGVVMTTTQMIEAALRAVRGGSDE